jgi:hypothetical protein
MDNAEKRATLFTQDTGQRQTKQTTRTTQRKGQHWVHKTLDKDKQNK